MQSLDEREYVFGHRQLAAIAFVMVGLMTVAAAMAYMVGRAATPSALTQQADPPPKKMIVMGASIAKPSASAASPDPVIVVQAPQPPAQASTVVANQPVTSSANPVAPAPAAPGGLTAPSPGSHYFQVVSTDREQGTAIVGKLSSAGVSAFLGEGPSPDRVRVYAGPVDDNGAQQQARSKIEAAGFRPFLKKF